MKEWKKIPMSNATGRTEVVDADPFVFVCCLPRTIRIAGTQVDCPPYPFKMRGDVERQADDLKHTAERMIADSCAEFLDPDQFNVSRIHLARLLRCN